ncbi:acetyl-CoA C-acetyltransferase [Paremcibacter congregatus]|uniref:Acetyl-CoA C-acyltransferase n=1 Tax=Paremcibacter congregatus TaxID=2043170 RepID=A0A2G4YTA3_9PROT|nr:acetyl-CoA C-acetyltransferase [Paremcibacter congregatus]PHZ85517.1 acetyl-CoA C-acyltransferase [Paremcibacter congregatus]QDE26475.1 acetyl-CoA C-acetyltransferase [Paremcibacter congregatus]
MTEVAIVSALRTPVGSFNGSLSSVPAHYLGEVVIKGLLQETGVTPEDISEVVLGQILTAGAGQNPARQASINAGLPIETTAYGINQLCGSGLRAVALGYQAIVCGDADIIIAGGQESMSQAQHSAHLRGGIKMGSAEFKDTMLWDALTDVFNNTHMGITAENIAEKWDISRDTQDAFAVTSQNKAEAAQASGKFEDEILTVTIKNRRGDIEVSEDEYIRKGVTLESLSGVRPAFKKDGTVTAANASGINDGAAAVMLMSVEEASKRGLNPLAIIKSWATAGVDPSIMGIGPVPASQKALAKAGWTIDDVDLVEANEAFAAQACAVGQDLNIPADKLNVNGGAIAIGHPLGASGARVLTTLLHEMKRRDVHKGLATLCIGGGMGVAMCVERP